MSSSVAGRKYMAAVAGLAAAAVLIAAGTAQVQDSNNAALRQIGEDVQLMGADLTQARIDIAALSDQFGALDDLTTGAITGLANSTDALAGRIAAVEQRDREDAAHIMQALAALTAKVDALQASVANNTARVAALEYALAKQTAGAPAPIAGDYSPVIRILYPEPDQFLAENTDSSQGGPGVKIWPDYVATRHDGTNIPRQNLDIAFVMHGPEPDKTVLGFHPAYHRGPSEYGQTTLAISYTDTVNGKDYTATESVTFYMGSTRK